MHELGFHLATAVDGVVYRDGLQFPVLLLVPLLLGSGRQLNPVYVDAITRLFDLKQCVGLAGTCHLRIYIIY